jgi:hypothetical protein
MLRTSAAVGAALLWAAPAAAAPANTLREMFAELSGCLAPVRLAEGTDVTLQFSLNRSGGVIGKPRITHAHWVGDDQSRKASAESIAKAFDECLPLTITDALGGAIAGHMIAYRLRTEGDKGA